MKILISGADGMLAKAIKEEFRENDLTLANKELMDITNYDIVNNVINKYKPEIIINCAAYTNVDKAEEEEESELAYNVNAIGPRNLAIVAEKNDILLIHISTDYVFSGDKNLEEIYNESEEKNPKNIYGRTKLEGENFIKDNCKKYYIFRTSWLYGEGKNFVNTMLNLAESHDEIRVVNDQHSSPTYTKDLANIIKQAIDKKIEYGEYNATNKGYTSWYEFAKKIYEIKNIKMQVVPITSQEFKSKAQRPLNSKMSIDKLLKYDINIPTYEDALIRFLKKQLA